MNVLNLVEKQQLRTDIPKFRPGDTIKVHVKIREGDKERIQVFEGICIAQKHGGARETFTVRKMSFGHGVERIFPLHSKVIDKVEIVRSYITCVNSAARPPASKKSRPHNRERGAHT